MHCAIHFYFAVLLLAFRGTGQALASHVHSKNLHHFMSKRDLSRYFGVEKHNQVPEYDIVHPFQVDSRGYYLTHHLTKVFRRSTDDILRPHHDHKVHYKVKAFGERFHLSLKKNHGLMAPNFKSNVLGENGKILSFRKPKNCHYHGTSMLHKGSRVAISNCNGLTGLIKDSKAYYFIEPLPGHLKKKIKPIGDRQPHLIYKNHKFHKMKHGKKDHKMKEEHETVHFCGTKDNSSILLNPLFHDEIASKRTAGSTNSGGTNDGSGSYKTIEAHLVIDQKMVNFHGIDDVEQYVLSLANIASKLLNDYTIGSRPAKYTLVKLSLLREPQTGLLINSHASNTLKSLGNWAEKQNKEDDSDPEHFDHASLITRFNICADSNQPCDTLGLAPVSGMCRFPVSATVSQDNGLMAGFTLAHETGHNIGMNHDYRGGCPDGENIMAQSSPGKPSAFEWSSCSRNYFDIYLKLDQASCLNDDPQSEPKDLSKLEKPGVLYDRDTQCEHVYGEGSKFCGDDFQDQICYMLWCTKPGRPGACSSNQEPAAEGTKCGEGKWCERGYCVEKGTEPSNAVDGGWSEWSNKYTCCTRTCGGGIHKRVRACNSPQPEGGGKDCEGEPAEYKICNQDECPQDDFRDKQCKEKNKNIYGERQYRWEWRPSDLENPCEIGCFIENTNRGYALGTMADGTDCKTSEVTGKCINGNCKDVGCDGIIGSSAEPDRCGVCNGDGSSCSGNGGRSKSNYRSGIPPSDQFAWVKKDLPCSVSCAGGISIQEGECRRTDDNSVVGEAFCDASDKPAKKELPCNKQLCPPAWRVDDWVDCSKTCSTGTRRRDVKCVQVVEDETEQVVDDELCAKTGTERPTDMESCNDFPCAAEWLAENFGQCSKTCGEGMRERSVQCIRPGKDDINEPIPDQECDGLVKPFEKEKCSLDPCPGQEECGGTFTDIRGVIRSPDFPNDYPSDKECVYSISVPSGSRIKLSFNSFQIDSPEAVEGEEECKGDRLEIFDGDCSAIEKSAITKYCGDAKPEPYTSAANGLCIKFITDESQSARGFDGVYATCTGMCDGTDGGVGNSAQPDVGSNDATSETGSQRAPTTQLVSGLESKPFTETQTALGSQPEKDIQHEPQSTKGVQLQPQPGKSVQPEQQPEKENQSVSTLREGNYSVSVPAAPEPQPAGTHPASQPAIAKQSDSSTIGSSNSSIKSRPVDNDKAIRLSDHMYKLGSVFVGEPLQNDRGPMKTTYSMQRQTTVTPRDDKDEEDNHEDNGDGMDEDKNDKMGAGDEQLGNQVPSNAFTLFQRPKGMVKVLKKDKPVQPFVKP